MKVEKKEKKEITELNQTVGWMCSKNYKERFIAEYHQLKIRYNRLKEFNEKRDRGELDFIPDCPKVVLIKQEAQMKDLLETLKKRALLENICLE